MSSGLRDRIHAEMESLHTIVCHSHTSLKSEYNAHGGLDLFSLMAYYEREINMATGVGSGQLYDGCATDKDRWERLKPVLLRTRNESYWRHNIFTYKAVFDFADDDLDDAPYPLPSPLPCCRRQNWYNSGGAGFGCLHLKHRMFRAKFVAEHIGHK